MSLHLCVFAEGREVAGLDVGGYADFAAFRQAVAELEAGERGSRFPTLLLQPDSDGEWSPAACRLLAAELAAIAAELGARPARPFSSEAQQLAAAARGLVPRQAGESFVDVDGEPLLERLQALAAVAGREGRPILFQ